MSRAKYSFRILKMQLRFSFHLQSTLASNFLQKSENEIQIISVMKNTIFNESCKIFLQNSENAIAFLISSSKYFGFKFPSEI